MEFYCYPDSTTVAKDPCPFCEDRITVDDSVSVTLATTCGDVGEFAKIVEEYDEICLEDLKVMEYTCCRTVKNLCSVCPGGTTVGEDYVVLSKEGMGNTRGNMMENAKLFEDSDVYCRSLKTMEFYCCPDSTTGAKDPCPFCGDGITVDYSVAVSAATTCRDVVEFSKIVEEYDEICLEDLKVMEYTCYRTVESICSV